MLGSSFNMSTRACCSMLVISCIQIHCCMHGVATSGAPLRKPVLPLENEAVWQGVPAVQEPCEVQGCMELGGHPFRTVQQLKHLQERSACMGILPARNKMPGRTKEKFNNLHEKQEASCMCLLLVWSAALHKRDHEVGQHSHTSTDEDPIRCSYSPLGPAQDLHFLVRFRV